MIWAIVARCIADSDAPRLLRGVGRSYPRAFRPRRFSTPRFSPPRFSPPRFSPPTLFAPAFPAPAISATALFAPTTPRPRRFSHGPGACGQVQEKGGRIAPKLARIVALSQVTAAAAAVNTAESAYGASAKDSVQYPSCLSAGVVDGQWGILRFRESIWTEPRQPEQNLQNSY